MNGKGIEQSHRQVEFEQLTICTTGLVMTDLTDNANVFIQLREASRQISEGFETIIKLAPDIALYRTLVESQNKPFLKNIINTPVGVNLDDNEIKFAVYTKELYEKGKLDILKSLTDCNLEHLLAEMSDLRQLSSNPPIQFSSSSNVSNEVNDDRLNTGNSDLSMFSPPTSTFDEPSRSENNHGNYFKNDGTASNSGNTSNKINPYLDTVGCDTKDVVDNANHMNEDDDNISEYSELYTQVAQISVHNTRNGGYISSNESVHKRNRNFNVFRDDDPPKLPEIHMPELIAKVFTHQSVLNYLNIPEESKVHAHNERLEFLGDAFLQFVVSMIIYEKFPNFNEGQMSILRSNIVSNSRLLKFSQIYGFDKQLKKNFNDTSILTGNNKIYADVFEAYLGAIAEQYMMETKDGETNVNDFLKGWFEAKNWLEQLCEEQLQTFDPSIIYKMQYSKSSKQDLRLLLGKLNVPDYVRCNIGNRRILSCVKIAKKVYGYGIGTSNKEADSRAATDAMSNPGIRKICPDDLWKKFEEGIGIDELGGLKFDQYPTKVSSSDLDVLRKEIAIKYKVGDIKLLVSKNNPHSLLIDDRERDIVKKELNEKHSLENTRGELDHLAQDKDRINEHIADREDDKKYPRRKYYTEEYTMGRGGVYGEEYKRIAKGSNKHRGGIHRNAKYLFMDEGEDGTGSESLMREIMCHEVLVKCDNVDMDSKNRINAIYAKRGGAPGYITYRTTDDEFLCELWFNNSQIVSYGLDKSKRNAAQKAAMLALKREMYYGSDSDSDSDEEEDEEEEQENQRGTGVRVSRGRLFPKKKYVSSEEESSSEEEEDAEDDEEEAEGKGAKEKQTRRRCRRYKNSSPSSSSSSE